MKTKLLRGVALALSLGSACIPLYSQINAPVSAAATDTVKRLGSIQKINGSTLILTTDQGTELAVKLQPTARVLRLAPGQKDLKSATLIQLSDLQVGDRVLVSGKLASDGVSLEAAAVIVMKQQDIAQKNQQELADWQRRSVGGLVKEVNSQTGSITLTVNNKTVLVRTTSATTYKRYAPDSVKWEDASAAKLSDILPGDQLRAKGNKNEDGSEISAEAVVAGTFRNISGLVTASDSANGTLTVQDLATKKPVSVKITSDSQMKKLPPLLAQRLAWRLKGGPQLASTAPPQAQGAHPGGGQLDQLMARLPSATMADLQKGDAVMIVSTQGSASEPPVAITLLDGVESILAASPSTAASQSLLTPWSLAGAPGGDQ